jgi:hypothetical protein
LGIDPERISRKVLTKVYVHNKVQKFRSKALIPAYLRSAGTSTSTGANSFERILSRVPVLDFLVKVSKTLLITIIAFSE